MGQQVPRALSSVDLELAGISGKASSPYAERVRLIHSLPSNLAPEQLERCRAFLESPLAGQPLPDLEFNGLKNELVFALLRQREGLTELAELLVRMSRAPDTDATWRDYCVHTRRRFAPRAAAIAAIRLSASLHSRLHFLGKCYPRINDAKSREAMADALWEALRTQRRGRAAGSAARQLMTLGRSFPEFPPGKVSAASLEALLDLASSDETKTALLQVCGTLGERGALPTARAIAGRNSAPVLRASAYPSSLRSSGRRYRGYQTIRFRFARVCHRRRRDARRRIRPAAPETPCSIGGRARLQACCCGHGQDTEVEPMNH